MYDEHLHDDDQIVIQFSTTPNIRSWRPPFFPNYASWVIRHLCNSPFSHVDFEIPPYGYLLGASNSPKATHITGNPNGVALRPRDYEVWGRRRRMVIRTEKAGAIRAAAMTQLGKPFDSSALWGFLSDAAPGQRAWQDTGLWFCAELIAWSFVEGGYWPDLDVWPMNRISPANLVMMFLFDPNWVNRETFWSVGLSHRILNHGPVRK